MLTYRKESVVFMHLDGVRLPMTFSCRNCGRTFDVRLDLELHREQCIEDTLVCRECGERFPADGATTDGWHYECPNEGCDATGIGEGLRQVRAVRATH